MSKRNSCRITRRQAALGLTASGLAASGLAGRRAFAAGGDIDAVLKGAVASKSVPGIVAMAADRQGVTYHGAFGVADLGTGQPMREDALFRIASMTKAITTTAALQLVEQGKFALDDPVKKYLPQFAELKMFRSFDARTGAYVLTPVAKTVTVRHLLTHTSGLEYNFDSPVIRDFKPRAGETYPVGPLLFEPGQEWHYGTSIDQLGHLVEKVSGETLEGYFHRHIFAPLRMTDTFYNVPPDKAARLLPLNHRQADGTIVKEAVQAGPAVPMPIGGGGLASTAADYIRFTRMILNGGVLDGARVLKPQTVAAMGRNQIGKLGVPVMKTAMPERTNDFTFVDGGRDKWGFGFLITAASVPGKRSAGSLSWGGIDNTYYWIDPARGVTGVILMQFLPFADPKALSVYDAFERGVYRSVKA